MAEGEEGFCQDLSPFEACGTTGSCEINGTIASCVCTAGWSQSREMTLFFITEDELEQGQSICNFNYDILVLLYVLTLVSTLAALINQIRYIKRKNQLRRLIPFLLGCSLLITLALYRLSSLEEALYGDDVFFCFLVANFGFCAWCAITIFNNRYFIYVINKLNFGDSSPNEVFRRHHAMNKYLLIYDFVLYQPIWIIVLADLQYATGLLIIKVSFILHALRVLYFIWTVSLIFNTFIRDMNRFIHNNRSKNVLIILDHQQKREEYIEKKLLPKTIVLKKGMIGFGFIFVAFLVIPACWDYALMFYGYMFPFNFMSWSIMSFFVINANLKTSLISKSSKKNSQVPGNDVGVSSDVP